MASGGQERRVLAGFALLLGLLLLSFTALTLWSRAWQRDVAAAWEQSLGTPPALDTRYPQREADAQARRLEEAAVAAGIELAPVRTPGRIPPRVTPAAGREFMRDSRPMVRWLEEALARPDRNTVPPPPEAVRFLEARRAAVEEVVTLLAPGPVPRWERGPASGIHGALPANLLGHLKLQRLLLAQAVVSLQEDRPAAARKMLQASWTLNRSLEEIELLARLMYLSVARLQLGVVRQMAQAGEDIRRQVDAMRPGPGIMEALRYEGWRVSRMPEIPAEGGRVASLWHGLARPYARASLLGLSDAYRRRLEPLDGELCGLEDLSRVLEPVPAPWWDLLSSTVQADLSGVLPRLRRFQVDRDLTLAILDAGSGRQSASRPGCPGDGYTARPAGPGQLKVAFPGPDPAPAEAPGLRLSLNFVVPAPGEP